MIEVLDTTRKSLSRRFTRGGIAIVSTLLIAAVISFLISLYAVRPIRSAYLATEIAAVQTMRAQNIAAMLSQLTTPTKLRTFFNIRNDLATELNLLLNDNRNLYAGNADMGLAPAGTADAFFTEDGQGLNDQLSKLQKSIESGFLADLRSADPKEAADLVHIIRFDINPQLRALLHHHSETATRRINLMTFYQVIALSILVAAAIAAWAMVQFRLASPVKKALTPAIDDENDPTTRSFGRVTGLPNLAHLQDHLMDEVMCLKGTENLSVVIHLDFPGIDDIAGQNAPILRRAVQRDIFQALQSLLRPGDIVTHIEETEFTVSLGHLTTVDAALPTLRAIAARFAEPYVFDTKSALLRLSMGVAPLFPSDRTPEKAIHNAAKTQAGGQKAGIVPALLDNRALPMNQKLPEFVATHMETGFEDNAIGAVFSPVHNDHLARAEWVQARGLWQHAKLGQVRSVFLDSMAACCGMDGRLAAQLFNDTTYALRRWDHVNAGIGGATIRLSKSALIEPKTLESLRWALDNNEINVDRIAIEIDDFLLADDTCRPEIEKLVEHGTPIFARDHGCEDFDLSMRSKQGIQGLILQRMAIANIDSNATARRLAAAKIKHAAKFNTLVLIEDVVTQEELAVLRQLGAHQFQGPLIGPAMDVAEAEENIQTVAQNAIAS